MREEKKKVVLMSYLLSQEQQARHRDRLGSNEEKYQSISKTSFLL